MIVILLALFVLLLGCALVKHRVNTLNLTLVPPMAPPSDANVVPLDAYRIRRARTTGYTPQTHSAS